MYVGAHRQAVGHSELTYLHAFVSGPIFSGSSVESDCIHDSLNTSMASGSLGSIRVLLLEYLLQHIIKRTRSQNRR
eukprot:SAG25_NODE_1645_length_2626_cov_42.107638_1_plen_76_part_00